MRMASNTFDVRPVPYSIMLVLTVLRHLDDGSMPKDKREASLEKIRNSKSIRCILISFKAGSTGKSRIAVLVSNGRSCPHTIYSQCGDNLGHFFLAHESNYDKVGLCAAFRGSTYHIFPYILCLSGILHDTDYYFTPTSHPHLVHFLYRFLCIPSGYAELDLSHKALT